MVHPNDKHTNEVYLDKLGIIHNCYHGGQSAKTLESTHERTMKIIVTLIEDDKPVWLLADIRDMGQYDMPARFVEMHARTVLPFWRLAIVTSDPHPIGERVSRQLTAMSGRKGEIRYFQREDDAKGWLLAIQGSGEPKPKINEPTQWSAL